MRLPFEGLVTAQFGTVVRMVPIESRLTAGVYWLVVPVVVAVTTLAAAIPARHAARIDPTVALRCE